MSTRVTRPRLVLGVVACALLVVGWYLTLAPTRIGGPMTPVIVRGTSMLPTYTSGDLVLAFRAPETRAGQVAVFRGPSGGHVIHRVIAVDGQRLVTQGDNRDRPDPWPTTTDDVLGVARFTVPGVGRHLLVLTDPLVVAAVAGAVAASVVLWPRRGLGARQTSGAVTLIVALAAAPVVGLAAGMTVTTDQLMSQTLTGPFDTYVAAPGGGGGGGGGCNGQGNQPGC